MLLLLVFLLVAVPWAECCGKERCQEICTNDIKASVEDERTSTTETCFEVCGSDSAESAEEVGETDPVKIQADEVASSSGSLPGHLYTGVWAALVSHMIWSF